MTETPAHPEPQPEPIPEPEPPQPIPPPDPSPVPEPPHVSAPATGAEFIDAGPDGPEAAFPPPGSYTDETALLSPVSEMSAETQLIPPVLDPSRNWHQPPPAEPFHARHERPGEWRYEPPEHLAYQHSRPAEVEDPTRIVHTIPPPPSWELPHDADDADRKRRRSGLWISVALTTTLLVCGGGAASAYVLLRGSDAKGAADPATAVDEFMTAVYTRQDSVAAADLVCREARDKQKLAARVEQIKGYAGEYDAPSFKWAEPAVDSQNDDRATVSVQLTMSTEDEKTAQQQLTFTAVRKTGWLVCEISG